MSGLQPSVLYTPRSTNVMGSTCVFLFFKKTSSKLERCKIVIFAISKIEIQIHVGRFDN